MNCRRIPGTGLRMLLAVVFLLSPIAFSAVESWHYPLYVSGGDYWRQRIRIEVRNRSNQNLNGKPIGLVVGSGSEQVSLSGVEARSIRVVDSAGTELLFDVSAPGGEPFRSGPIPNGSLLSIPVECPPFGSKHYWIYFDNPEAWLVPDYLRPPGLLNGGVEEGQGNTPTWWQHDGGDPHHRASWVDELPRSGLKCLKLQVTPGAASSWISTRQTSIPIDGGRTYTLSGWVRAQDVSSGSQTGWYLHVATPGNPMAINQGLNTGGGTYGWTNVSFTFTTPSDAVSASVGTMLWGNGTAWFDDVSLEPAGTAPPTSLEITTSAAEILHLTHAGQTDQWFDDDPADDRVWDYRVPLHFINVGGETKQVSGSVNLRRYAYWPDLNPNSYRIVEGTMTIPSTLIAGEVIFTASLPPLSQKTYYLYFSKDSGIPPPASLGGLSDETGNLVSNPSFEAWSGNQPTGWVFQAATPNTTYGRISPGRFGNSAAHFTVPHSDSAIVSWPGWRQDVAVIPNNTYRFRAWVKLDDVRGTVRVHAHTRDSKGNLVGTHPYLSIGSGLTGTTDWTQLLGTFTMPSEATTFQIHLTMNGTGTLAHDGILLVGNVSHPVQGPVEVKEVPSEMEIWTVPAIVKVFQDDPPRQDSLPPKIFAAGGEVEPLQLVLRSNRMYNDVQIVVEVPRLPSGQRLDRIETSVVGYVPVAHTSDYYSLTAQKDWERIVITGRPGSDGVLPSDIGQGSDGWVGWWPDPLIPASELDLQAGRSQPVWLTIHVPEGAHPGDYVGKVRILNGGAAVAETPFTVHVWDFSLPVERHLGAIYDVRTGSRFQIPGQTAEVSYSKLVELMTDHRIGPDRVLPDPIFDYRDGEVTAEYSEFDQVASYFIEALNVPFLYTPSIFYCFGWGNLPRAFFGEEPYPGAWPFANADRAQLRDGYKKAYQKTLRDFWRHLEEKGWQDRFVLYISDEPHYRANGVIEQMQALCDMIHEVDPAIPIYSSVWDHVPAWDGYLDIWGIGQFGSVPTEKMRALKTAGDRLWFTTDGQMCLDTPFNAIERLLPHIAFHYDVEAYEFWGIDWLSDHDPYRFGWHSPVQLVFNPDEPAARVIYPNGDGYLVYPGADVGQDRAIPTIRLAQAREGLEDYEYLRLLHEVITKAEAEEFPVADGERALQRLHALVSIPGPSGRYSTQLLPDPSALYRAREAAGQALEELSHLLQNPPGLPSEGSQPAFIFPQFVTGTAAQSMERAAPIRRAVPNRTRIILSNHSAQQDFGKLVFKNPEGEPAAVSIGGIRSESFNYRLKPWGTLDLQTDGVGTLQTGTVEVYSNRSAEATTEGALVYDLLGESVSVPGFTPSCWFRFLASLDPEERSALAFYNPQSDRAIRLDLELRNQMGRLEARRSVELQPSRQLAAFLDEESLFADYFSARTSDFKGTIEASSLCSDPFAALGLIQRRSNGALFTVSIEPDQSENGERYFPLFVNGETQDPSTGTPISNQTRLILLNDGLQAESGALTFKDETGGSVKVPVAGELTDSLRYTLPGLGAFETSTEGWGELQSGVLEIASDLGKDSRLAPSLVLELLNHSVSVPAPSLSPAHLAYVSVNNIENTGIAIFNPNGDSLVRIALTLKNQEGTPLAQNDLILAPREQISYFVDEARLFQNFFRSNTAHFSGTLEIRVIGQGVLSVVSFLQKRSTGALVTIPIHSSTK